VSVTVNVAWPAASVVPETVVIVDDPPLFARVTVLFGNGLPLESLIVAVIVEAVDPSAVTVAGDALTVESDALAVAAAGRTATITAVSSRLVIVELFAPIAPDAAWMTSNVPVAERTPGAPLCEETLARTFMPVGVVKLESPAVP
jgi:hypothetical protein